MSDAYLESFRFAETGIQTGEDEEQDSDIAPWEVDTDD